MVHDSGGTKANGQHRGDYDQMATDAGHAVNALYHYKAHGVTAKALVITPILEGDTVPDMFMREITGNPARARVTYDYDEFANLTSEVEASLQITYAGANQWPTVTSGGNCIDLNDI